MKIFYRDAETGQIISRIQWLERNTRIGNLLPDIPSIVCKPNSLVKIIEWRKWDTLETACHAALFVTGSPITSDYLYMDATPYTYRLTNVRGCQVSESMTRDEVFKVFADAAHQRISQAKNFLDMLECNYYEVP